MLLNCGVGEDSWESLRTARRSNQSILKEISPEYSLEGLRLKVKFQYFGNLMAKNWLIRKDPDAGKDWRQEEKGTTEDEMVVWHQRFNGWIWVYSGSWWWTGRPGVLQSMGSCRVGHDWLNWTELNHVPVMACNCTHGFFLVWLLIVETDRHLLLLWLCNCYSLNTILSLLVNRNSIEFYITKATI